MIASQRKRAIIASDSSEDGRKQSRRKRNSQKESRLSNKKFKRRQDEINDNDSSDSSIVTSHRKNSGRRPVMPMQYSSSSENELLHQGKRGCLRPLSDYDSGDNSGKAGSSSGPSQQALQQHSQERSYHHRAEDSDSSFDSHLHSIVTFKRRSRQNYYFNTDSSDSGVPVGFRRATKRRRLPVSSDDNSSEDSAHSNRETSNRNNRGTNRLLRNTHELIPTRSNPARQNSISEMNHRRNIQDTNNRRRISRSFRIRRRVPVIQSDESSSSESVIRPRRALRSRRTILQSDNTSDSDVIAPGRSRRRQAAVLPLQSDEDNVEENTNALRAEYDLSKEFPLVSSITMTDKTCLGISSDSDSECEKCPICLARLKCQEIGTPASCDHCFCFLCIQEWAKTNNTCPVDRLPFNLIVVRAEYQGKIVREVPVETAQPAAEGIEEFGLDIWWEFGGVNMLSSNSEDEEWEFPDWDSDGDGPDEVCCVCGSTAEFGDMILCDYCNNAYHLRCVRPRLQYIPAEDWYCTDCINNEMSISETSSSLTD